MACSGGLPVWWWFWGATWFTQLVLAVFAVLEYNKKVLCGEVEIRW